MRKPNQRQVQNIDRVHATLQQVEGVWSLQQPSTIHLHYSIQVLWSIIIA